MLRNFSFIYKPRTSKNQFCTDEKWIKLIKAKSELKGSGTDLGISLLKKIEDKSLTQLDYTNISEMAPSSTDFIKEIIYKYNTTQVAKTTNSLANFAIIYGFIKLGDTPELISLLKDRIKSQLFLDSVSATILVEDLRSKSKTREIIEVIWEFYLQGYFGNQDLNETLVSESLSAINEYIKQNEFLNQDIPIEAENEENEEPKYERVPYLRNPNDDEFFDLKDVRSKSGRLLLFLLSFVAKTKNNSFMVIASLFSYALSMKPAKVASILSKTKIITLHQNSLSLLEDIVKSCKISKTTVSKGEPDIPTQEHVDACIQEIKSKIKVSDSGLNFIAELDNIQKELALSKKARIEISKAHQAYVEADELLVRSIEDLTRKKYALNEAKRELSEILDKEEYLTYFDKSSQIKLEAWLAPRTRQEKSLSQMKKWRQDMVRYHQKNDINFEK